MRAAATLVLAAALLLGACSGDDDSAAPATTESTTTTTEAPTTTVDPSLVPVIDLEVGACFDEDAVREDEPSLLQRVRVIDCEDPHRNEVYASVDYEPDSEDYPGNGVLAEFAQQRCVSAFPDYVGTPVERTNYGIGTVYPDEASWETGDRVVLCVLYDSDDEPLEGSAEGTGG